MTLDRDRPEILQPPQHPQACCTQQTITVPPAINAKTTQKHDYPSKAHRLSYARRTGAERGFATAKDPATNDISRGWCRLMGLAPLMIAVTCLLVVRNQRILARMGQPGRKKTNAVPPPGLPPRTRKRRRKTLTALRHRTPPNTRTREKQPPNTPSNTPPTTAAACPETRTALHRKPPRERETHATPWYLQPRQSRGRTSDPNVKIGPH